MISRRFVASPDSVGEARRFASEYIADLSPELRDTVSLMVSELSTNSLVHACVGFEVTIDRSLHLLRVAVTDQGDGTPAVQTPGSYEPHGRGLRIVEALSDHWGITEASGDGKTVWFQIGLTSASDDLAHRSDAGSAGSQPVGSVAASRASPSSTPMDTPADTPTPYDSPDASSGAHRPPSVQPRTRRWLPRRPLPHQSRRRGAARPRVLRRCHSPSSNGNHLSLERGKGTGVELLEEFSHVAVHRHRPRFA
jgi:anti-sigma regulatory factor (Ser/Thr protein kinase)